ncbi:MAG: RHS repeat-associated core domain-containing protein [Kiritimatiellae bacterium]|nr:RHS repeat-associated core domain-containing protein [Kiritimatiellia bacterium]
MPRPARLRSGWTTTNGGTSYRTQIRAFSRSGLRVGLYDPDTGLTWFGYRDYDPMTGRWLAKDPILFGGGQANLYLYCHGDPVNWVDSLGLGEGNAVYTGMNPEGINHTYLLIPTPDGYRRFDFRPANDLTLSTLLDWVPGLATYGPPLPLDKQLLPSDDYVAHPVSPEEATAADIRAEAYTAMQPEYNLIGHNCRTACQNLLPQP